MVITLLLPVTIIGYRRGLVFMNATRNLRETVLTAWQWSKVIPQNAGLSLLSPFPEQWGITLEDKHILRVKRWDANIAANWNLMQSRPESQKGSFDVCEIVPGVNRLVVEGWTRSPEGHGPADYVLFTTCEKNGTPRPWLVLPTDTQVRPDVRAAWGEKRMLRSGFRQDLAPGTLPAGPVTIAAWAVDMKQQTISLLPNLFVMDAGRDLSH